MGLFFRKKVTDEEVKANLSRTKMLADELSAFLDSRSKLEHPGILEMTNNKIKDANNKLEDVQRILNKVKFSEE